MILSSDAEMLISALQDGGFEAYAVGGCVRDCLMGRQCSDIDITTSATPSQMEKVLSDKGIIYFETGIKHGTITAVVGKKNYEITTYRSDGEYADSRHPKDVRFVKNIKEDLARRDFTINAMAYNSQNGLIDIYGGRADISDKIIRAVGDADERFSEDALRIMRALRFSSVLSFQLDKATEQAVFNKKDLLLKVSNERIFSELSKLLLGDGVFDVLMKYKTIIGVVIPELKAIFDVKQNNKWHLYDVWEHTCRSVAAAPDDVALRLTMLFHDIGKAYTKTTDDKNVDHFLGHQKISAEYADTALKRLKVSREIYDRVMALVPIHDVKIAANRKNVKKWLSRLGEGLMRDLIFVKKADKAAQNPKMTAEELHDLDLIQEQLDSILNEGEPFTVKDLNINGYDLIKLGYSGVEIGEKLELLLNLVIDEKIDNDKNQMIEYLKNAR